MKFKSSILTIVKLVAVCSCQNRRTSEVRIVNSEGEPVKVKKSTPAFNVEQLKKQKKFKDCKYLEIGSQYRKCFDLVKASTKHDVEPDVNCNPVYKMTSDRFFETHISSFYNVIFIDGLHHYEQVLKDVYNSSKHLLENGYIILHDCLPNSKDEQTREQITYNWLGDVWKAQAFFVENFKKVLCRNFDTI